MKLLRDGALVAEGSAKLAPGDPVMLFSVTRWHAAPGDHRWIAPALWTIEDGARVRQLRGFAKVHGVHKGALCSLAIALDPEIGDLRAIDVRDDPDA